MAPVFDDHEMCDAKECFYHKTILIAFIKSLEMFVFLAQSLLKACLFNTDC